MIMKEGCLWQNTKLPAFLMNFICENIFFKKQEYSLIEQTDLLQNTPTYKKATSLYHWNFNKILTSCLC